MTLFAYFTAVLDDGDYLNDWLTHLPHMLWPVLELAGWLLANLVHA